LETQYFILSAIGLATDDLKLSIKKHNSKLRKLMLNYVRLIKKRRDESESEEEVMKMENIFRKLDRIKMAEEDKLSLLITRYDRETSEREKRIRQEYLQKLERHRSETQANSSHRSVQMQAYMHVQELKLQQKEREIMYFNEFQQRAVDWKLKQISSTGCAKEITFMIIEDKLAHEIIVSEKEKRRHELELQIESQKVKEALEIGKKLYGGDGNRAGRSIAERNAAAKEYQLQSLNTVPDFYSDSDSVCSQAKSVNIFSETKHELLSSLKFSGSLSVKDDSSEQQFRKVLLQTAITMEDRCGDLFKNLIALTELRSVRSSDFRVLSEYLTHFEIFLRRLNHVRHELHVQKYETKNARQTVLNEAIDLEKKIGLVHSSIDKYALKLLSVMKEELLVFQYLFVKGGGKSFEYAHSPHLFKKKEVEPNTINGGWLNQKREKNKISRKVNKTKLKDDKNDLPRKEIVVADDYYLENDEIINSSVDISRLDRDYYSSISAKLEVLKDAPKPYFLADKLEAANEVHSKRKLPGLTKYLDPNPFSYNFYVFGENIRQWLRHVVKYMRECERIWRQHYRSHLISFYQRLLYVTKTENTLSTSSSAAILDPHDSVVTNIIDKADILDLFELIASRASIKLKVRSIRTI
jgi:hypothetical protein